VVRSSFVYQRKSALILPEIHQRDWLLQSLPVSFGFHRKSTVDPVTRIQKILHKSNPRITIQTQNRGKILHKSNNPSQSKPNTNTKCKSNLRISLTKKKIKHPSDGLEESGVEEVEGGERKREEERIGQKSTYSGWICLCIRTKIRPAVGFSLIRPDI
jgi:hypothetical protein